MDAEGFINRNRVKFNIALCGAFIVYCFVKLLYWLPKDIFGDGINFWIYTDWLIDYSGGFVRRGLSGVLIGVLSMGDSPKMAIGILTWLVFIIVVIAYLRLIFRLRGILSPFICMSLLFMPSLFPFYLHDHGAFGRKETIGFLIIMWHLYVLERRVVKEEYSSYIKGILPIALILLPAHIFVHEASFLLFVPIHVIITYSMMRLNSSDKLRKSRCFILYAPSLIAFMGCECFWATDV